MKNIDVYYLLLYLIYKFNLTICLKKYISTSHFRWVARVYYKRLCYYLKSKNDGKLLQLKIRFWVMFNDSIEIYDARKLENWPF